MWRPVQSAFGICTHICYIVALACAGCVVYTDDLLLAEGAGSGLTTEAPVDTSETDAAPDPTGGASSEPAGPAPVPQAPAPPTPGQMPADETDAEEPNEEPAASLEPAATDAPAADDECPNSDKTEPGQCGCDVEDTDSDGDDTPDCLDECVDDPDKTEEGFCGCGEADDDRDGDETPNCLDECPDDPDKTEAGGCGCGEVDIDDDADGDGVFDCVDECPDDPDKSEPGACGCGYPDTAVGEEAICDVLSSALVHRYDFTGSSANVADRAGNADGTVNNTNLAGGQLTLAGDDQYVDLPTNVLSGLVDATVEVWVTWSGEDLWQRIFDFGSSDGAAGAQGTATSSLFLTPASLGDGGDTGLRVGFRALDQDEVTIALLDPFPTNVEVVVAVVVDDTNDTLSLYSDGKQMGQVELPYSLEDIDFANTWIGQSQFEQDLNFVGAINEFRIYSRALGEAELSYSYEQGTDPSFF